MVDVAVEEGCISGGINGGEDRWGEGLGLATEVRSGVIAVSLADWTLFCSSFISTHILSILIKIHTLFKHRRPMPWKWAWRVVLRMYLGWLDVRMWW